MLMELDLSNVRAGARASFTLKGFLGRARVRISVDGETIYEHECEDPPCHEFFRVAPQLVGRVLEAVATDASGATIQQSVSIGLPDDLELGGEA